MPCRLAPSWTLVLGVSMLVATSSALGQESQVASRGPRFLLAAWTPGTEGDASRAPVLRRRVSLDLSTVTIGEALKEVTRQAALEISYSPRVVPLDRTVSLHAQGITVAAALTEILLDVAVDVSVTSGGALALVPRTDPTPRVAFDTGSVAGQVRDSATGSPIAGATVSIDGARRITTTDARGRYRISGLAPGAYAVRARFIGYSSLVASIEVSAGQEVDVDFPLERSAQPLDQVVVTGTVVPTEVKALPTPITVVSDSQITLQRPHTVMDLFRQAVPTGVSFSPASNPELSVLSVRGASTLLTGGLGGVKVFVDGIEVALSEISGVDPNNIERMEVIRGPQAAAIYGSAAIGGVVQFFTKRGDPNISRPQVSAEASLGMIQTPYEAKDNAPRQTYKASLRGGGPDVGYHILGDYSHTGDWIPNGAESAQSNYGASGGVQYTHGILTLDFSGRYRVQNTPVVSNPALATTGLSFFAKPTFRHSQFTTQTVAARVDVAPLRWWQHSLRVGVDRWGVDLHQSRARLTTPADTLLWLYATNRAKTFVAYNTTVGGRLTTTITGSLTAGIDHHHMPDAEFFSFGSLNTTGTIQTAGIPISAYRTIVDNTGYFAQAQVGFRDALFLTGGLRAEHNTGFGDSLGTPLSPRVGLSYVRPLGSTSLKVRGSWGRAIRAPDPTAKSAAPAGGTVRLANPNLGPERQWGWDAGIDAFLGALGSLSITYFDQTATDLIQFVPIEPSSVPTFQYQNVGRVKNTGVEIEAVLALGAIQVKGQYGYARARIVDLGPSYTGDLLVGDQTLDTPRHTAGAFLFATPARGTTVSVGFTYVGSWNEYDNVAMNSCFGGTGPCQPTSREYIVVYPPFTKLQLSVFQRLSPFVSGFVSVENLANNNAFEYSNSYAVMGRVTTLGLRFQY